jgi:hypothetical protein
MHKLIQKTWFIFKKRVKLFALLLCFLFISACGDDCQTLQDYINDGTGTKCFACPLFKILTNSASQVAQNSWDALAPALQTVIALIAAIYIAVYTLKMFSSFGKQTFSDYLTGSKKGLAKLVFKTAIIVLLLGNATIDGKNMFIVRGVIAPLLEGALTIGSKLSLMSGNLFASTDSIASTPWKQLFDQVFVAARTFNDAVYQIIAMSNAFACGAILGFPLTWEWTMLIYSLILYCFGWLLLLGITFYMVDLIINLTVGAVLLPLAVACAISDKTVTYTKNIWNIFVNAFFSFIILGIVIGFTLQLIENCLNLNIGGTSHFGGDSPIAGEAAVVDTTTNSVLQELDLNAAIDENQVKVIANAMKTNGSFILLLVCLTIVVKLIEGLKEIVQKISDTSGLSTAGSKGVAPLAKDVVKSGKRIGKWGAKVGTDKLLVQPATAASRALGLDKKYNNLKNSLQAARGYLTGTGAQGYRAWWR